MTAVGNGPESDQTDKIETFASTAPVEIKVDQSTENKISFDWDPPTSIGQGLTLQNYELKINKTKVATVSTEQATIDALSPANYYTLEITPMYKANQTKDKKGETAKLNFVTIPKRPEIPSLLSTSTNGFSILLSAVELAAGAQLKQYTLEYYRISNASSGSELAGSKRTQASVNETVKVSGLATGALYHVYN